MLMASSTPDGVRLFPGRAGAWSVRRPTVVLVVGHSAACSLAWAGADARVDKVGRVAMIGGFSQQDGEAYADFFPVVDGVVPFPGWEPFEGPDSDDMSEELKERFTRDAVPVPGSVTQGIVHLSDERRYDVPVTLVCPEFSPAEAREWVDGGEVPELAKAKHLDYVDIDSGHWPIFTRPRELAEVLDGLTR
jgi:pimeloyl-ACP methyl ester carboxylesterase